MEEEEEERGGGGETKKRGGPALLLLVPLPLPPGGGGGADEEAEEEEEEEGGGGGGSKALTREASSFRQGRAVLLRLKGRTRVVGVNGGASAVGRDKTRPAVVCVMRCLCVGLSGRGGASA